MFAETLADQEFQAAAGDADNFGLSAEEQQFANAAPPQQSAGAAQADFGKKLKSRTMAIRLRRKKWGINKKLEHEQIADTAQQFHAESSRISASKKLIDSRNKKFRACTSTLNAAVQYWREMSVPYPEFGVRLMRKDRLPQVKQQLAALKAELADNVADLKLAYNELIEESRVQLGDLFHAADYPTAAALDSLFALDWEFPSLQPDQLLKQLDPQLYEQQAKLIEARFEQAVQLATDAFVAEFHGLVSNLAERLQIGEDGKPKVFQERQVAGLCDFFAKFKDLNVGSSAELDALVEQAQKLVTGDAAALAKSLRKDAVQRQHLQQSLAEISVKLEAALVNKPVRKMDLFDGLED